MYVDDRLGRRSRARSGLDQLDVAEDLFAVVAAAVAMGTRTLSKRPSGLSTYRPPVIL